jgi:hypothetical protein
VPTESYPNGRVWEVLRLTLSQTYDLEEPPPVEPVSPLNQPAPAGTVPPTSTSAAVGRRLSDLTADLIFEPVFGVKFRGTAGFDPYARDIRSATTDASYETKDFRASFGTRHGLGGELEFVQGEVMARITPSLAVRFATNYDLLSGTIVENRFEVSYRRQCWAITAAFIDRTNEDEFRVTINLLELGQYGFGRVFAAQ